MKTIINNKSHNMVISCGQDKVLIQFEDDWSQSKKCITA